jgi:hypothetical protein
MTQINRVVVVEAMEKHHLKRENNGQESVKHLPG